MKKTEKVLLSITAIVQVAVLAFLGVCFVLNQGLIDEICNEEKYIEDAYSLYQETVDEIKTKQGADTENAEALYISLYENESLTGEEKTRLTAFIQYFVDNKYIDCEEVCNKLSNFTINKNDPDLLDLGIAAEYQEDNSITFANRQERKASLPHELHHCIENAAMPYDTMGWFGEGFACLVSYEYFDSFHDAENIQTYFVRGMCELVGPEVLFETSATGDPDVLINALVKKGINKKDVRKLFGLFSKIKDKIDFDEDTCALRVKSVQLMVDMYNTVYDNPKKISKSFCEVAESILGICEGVYTGYCINSQTRNTYDLQKKYVYQKNWNELYKKAR